MDQETKIDLKYKVLNSCNTKFKGFKSVGSAQLSFVFPGWRKTKLGIYIFI